MENIFISLGCSLTAIPGWVDDFNDRLGMKIFPLAEGASSNITQVYKLKNHLIEHNLLDKMHRVVLLWQITSPQRHGLLLDDNPDNEKFQNSYNCAGTNFSFTDYYRYQSALFKDRCIGLLSNNRALDKNTMSTDAYFEQFIADILIFSKLVKKIIVWYGWENIYDEDRKKKIVKLFENNGIEFIEPIVDYCKKNNLPFFFDEDHPTKESSIKWGQNILLPKIKDIG